MYGSVMSRSLSSRFATRRGYAMGGKSEGHQPSGESFVAVASGKTFSNPSVLR